MMRLLLRRLNRSITRGHTATANQVTQPRLLEIIDGAVHLKFLLYRAVRRLAGFSQQCEAVEGINADQKREKEHEIEAVQQ
ncbi:MAG: hypothetical protein ACJ8KO_14395 [Sulfurifustaceae bacterium]